MKNIRSASPYQRFPEGQIRRFSRTPVSAFVRFSCSLFAALAITTATGADRNAPTSVNALFSDVTSSAADLYDLYGFPGNHNPDSETVVIALTFAAEPQTGVFDQGVMYRIYLDPDPRLNSDELSFWEDTEAFSKKFLEQNAGEIRVTFNDKNQARLSFIGFPENDFSMVIPVNQTSEFNSPAGHALTVFAGGRDDPFFADQTGLMRAINYGPQFYQIAHDADEEFFEFPLPKTLLELKDNTFFNADPNQPLWGISEKRPAPEMETVEALELKEYRTDSNGQYHSVFSGQDSQAGSNVNAIIVEIPLAYLTTEPQLDRVVRSWSESWLIRASKRADSRYNGNGKFNENLDQYERVDTNGVAFFDTLLNQRDSEQQETYNLSESTYYIRRFAHLAWGFAPSLNALGLNSCFDAEDERVSQQESYNWTMPAFNLSQRCFFQRLNMPDDRWNKNHKALKPPRAFQAFTPNLISIDMDTSGTWPFGRRPEDPVASRFLALFLDMENGCNGPCNIDSLNNPSFWDKAPVTPKQPPNPLENDKPFLDAFPYLAAPWGQ